MTIWQAAAYGSVLLLMIGGGAGWAGYVVGRYVERRRIATLAVALVRRRADATVVVSEEVH